MLPPQGGFLGVKKEPVDKKRPSSSLTALLASQKEGKGANAKKPNNVSPFDALLIQAELAKTLPPTPSPDPHKAATVDDAIHALKRARIHDDDPLEADEDSSGSIRSSSSDEIAQSAPSDLALLSFPRMRHFFYGKFVQHDFYSIIISRNCFIYFSFK